MHTVDIGICGHNDLVIAQTIKPFLDIECGLKQIEFLVLVDDLLRKTEAVKRLTTQ